MLPTIRAFAGTPDQYLFALVILTWLLTMGAKSQAHHETLLGIAPPATASQKSTRKASLMMLAETLRHVVTPERFFLDAERPGSRVALRRVGRNLGAYARWGFIASERPVADPISKRAVGR
jgi:hypothetical protein